MRNKLITACLAVAAFAAFAALPSGASAAPCVTDPSGTCLATGNKITVTQHSDSVLTTPVGTVTCTVVSATGTLQVNDHTAGIRATISSASFEGTGLNKRCTSSINDGFGGKVQVQVTSKPPYCLFSTANDTAEIWDGDCPGKTTGAKFVFDVFTQGGTFLQECEYERQTAGGAAAPLSATYNTNISPATAEWETAANGHVDQLFNRIKGSALICPASGTLTGSTTVFTDAANEPGVSITA